MAFSRSHTYGVLAVPYRNLNHPISVADEMSCWQNGKCLVLIGRDT